MAKAKSHKDVEYHAVGPGGKDAYFKTFDEAAAFVAAAALSDGNWHDLSVLIHSEAGARWWGGDHAVESYRSDPDASVFEQFKMKVQSAGMIH